MGQADGLSLAPALPRPASAALVTANKPLRGGAQAEGACCDATVSTLPRLRGLFECRPCPTRS
jgi:hypothetical protein